MNMVMENGIDVLAIPETCLKEGPEGDTVTVTELKPTGYEFHHLTRGSKDQDTARMGGGVGILIRNELSHESGFQQASLAAYIIIWYPYDRGRLKYSGQQKR